MKPYSVERESGWERERIECVNAKKDSEVQQQQGRDMRSANTVRYQWCASRWHKKVGEAGILTEKRDGRRQ